MADSFADSFGLGPTKNIVLPHESVDDSVKRYVLSACTKAITETMDFRRWLLEASKRFEGMRSTRSLDSDDPGVPWHWASNVALPIESIAAESLIPRFNAATTDSDPIYRVTTPLEEASIRHQFKVEKAEMEATWTAWYQELFTRRIRLRRIRKDTYLNLCIDGSGIEGPEWDALYRQTSRTQAILVNEQGEVMVEESGHPRVFPANLPEDAVPEGFKKRLVQQKGSQRLYEGPRIRSWRLAECIWPQYATSPVVDELDFFAVQMWKSPSWFQTREGDPIEGKLKHVTELMDRYKHGLPDDEKTRAEDSLVQGLTFPKMPGKILTWLFFGKFDVDKDGVDEEIIAMVAPKERMLLGWRISQFARRPFFHYQLFHMPGRFPGRGLPHVGKGLRDMVDFYANAANNRANLYLDPPFQYEADSGFDPDTMEFGTGAQFGPLRSGAIGQRKLGFLEMPVNQEVLADKFISFYIGLFQRLTSITDVQLGGSARSQLPSLKTKGGTLAVLGESNFKFADWIREFQELSEEEAEFIDALIQDMADDDALARMTDVPIDLKAFALPKRFHATGNSQTMNRHAMQEVFMMLFEHLVQDPVLGIKPETQLQIRKRLLELFDIDLTLPDVQEVQKSQIQKLAQALAQLPPEKLAAAIQSVQQAKQSGELGNENGTPQLAGIRSGNGQS